MQLVVYTITVEIPIILIFSTANNNNDILEYGTFLVAIAVMLNLDITVCKK